jgi:hypothetical protein
MFWRQKKQQVEQVVDEVATTATELAEKTLTIGPGGVLLLLGAAAVGAAATYYVSQRHRNKKAARSGTASSKSDPKAD